MPTGGKEAFLSKVTFRKESNWVSKTKQMLKNMKTIEERAENYSNKVWTNPMFAQEWEECKRDYIQGATEQKAIDIDKACLEYEKELRQMKRILNEIKDGAGDLICISGSLIQFRKAMEEYYGNGSM